MECRADHRHDDGRRRTVSRNVCDQYSALIAWKTDNVIIITADIATGLIVRGKGQVSDRRQFRRKNHSLHFCGAREFAIQRISAQTDFTFELLLN